MSIALESPSGPLANDDIGRVILHSQELLGLWGIQSDGTPYYDTGGAGATDTVAWLALDPTTGAPVLTTF